jgi:hypothetical protein
LTRPGRWPSRLGWFVLLWATGVATVAVIGYAIRLVLL